MYYIYVVENENKIKISFDNDLNNRRFNFGKGAILLQFYTEQKNLYKNIINGLLQKFNVIDDKEFIFDSPKKDFLLEVLRLKQLYEIKDDNKVEVKKDIKVDIKEENKIEVKEDIKIKKVKKEKVIKKTANDNETVEQKRINKIKKDVEKKFKMSFDSLAPDIKKFLLQEDNKSYFDLTRLYHTILEDVKKQVILTIKHFFTDEDFSRLQCQDIAEKVVHDLNGRRLCLIDFEEMIYLKQEIPKLNILNFARKQIQTKEQFKIYEREYLKDNYDGFLIKANRREAKKKYARQLKYKFEDMKYIKGELTNEELEYLAMNTKLNKKIHDKYFSNLNMNNLEQIRNNLMRNPNRANFRVN
ncbi:MAG: hypothetical protein CMF62_02505 [Magnetococcales bacterium]|nr:hypothetical protein [Magnetococcales bacterium]|tara:strand:- start:6057 stop:7127 length:1071 start_codon:yes stop_codon:yes gene_type:complete